MSRRFFVGGNWKCNGTTASIGALLGALNAESFDGSVDVVVSPPFIYLPKVLAELRQDWRVAAQDCHPKQGAFTSAVSAEMVLDAGIGTTIIGHSERRDVFGDDDAAVAGKVAHALTVGLHVIACLGEHLEDRQAGKTEAVVFAQMAAIAGAIEPAQWSKVVLAYEPVWAIGTGVTASPAQAQDVHAKLRAWLAENVGAEVAATTRIIYGGSVKAGNCVELAGQADVDGFLVGGAALKPVDFAAIVRANK